MTVDQAGIHEPVEVNGARRTERVRNLVAGTEDFGDPAVIANQDAALGHNAMIAVERDQVAANDQQGHDFNASTAAWSAALNGGGVAVAALRAAFLADFDGRSIWS